MDYVLECFKLVYWVFFKKNTLIEWLKEIDPRLGFRTSPFRYWKDFRRNPKLKRYAIQTVVLSAIAPAVFAIISNLAIGSLYIAITGEPFDFVEGVAGGVAGGVTFGMAFGMALGVAEGLLEGVLGSVSFGVTFGVAGAVAALMAFTVASFPALFRIYFWLPQVVWMLGLNFLAERSEKFLKFLPPNFDEITFLPLPFLDKILIETYPNAPDATRQQLAYLRKRLKSFRKV